MSRLNRLMVGCQVRHAANARQQRLAVLAQAPAGSASAKCRGQYCRASTDDCRSPPLRSRSSIPLPMSCGKMPERRRAHRSSQPANATAVDDLRAYIKYSELELAGLKKMLPAAGHAIRGSVARAKEDGRRGFPPRSGRLSSRARHGPAATGRAICRATERKEGNRMFDLIVTGGTAVLPSGAEPADIAVSGGKIAAIGGPGKPRRHRRRAGRRRRRPDRDAGRRRSAYPLQFADPVPRPQRGSAERAAGAGQPRRALWRHDHLARFRAVPAGPAAAAIDRAAPARMGRRLLLRLRLPPAAARQAVARRARPVARGNPGRATPRSRCSPPTSGQTGWVGWCSSATSGKS